MFAKNEFHNEDFTASPALEILGRKILLECPRQSIFKKMTSLCFSKVHIQMFYVRARIYIWECQVSVNRKVWLSIIWTLTNHFLFRSDMECSWGTMSYLTKKLKLIIRTLEKSHFHADELNLSIRISNIFYLFFIVKEMSCNFSINTIKRNEMKCWDFTTKTLYFLSSSSLCLLPQAETTAKQYKIRKFIIY